MKSQSPILFYLLAMILFISTSHHLNAQLSLSGQLRARGEYRSGQGSPIPENADPAIFISQRTRLNLEFNTYRLKFGLALQDVRVWGQDLSTINRTTTQNNNGLMLHEAWAQISLTDTTNKKENLAVKFGRQELILDDQRLVGNLDWLQQARHHDAVIIKYIRNKWNAQAGAAYNQNKENSSGTIYSAVSPGNYATNTNGGNMYKSFEFLHVSRKLVGGSVSALFFSDQFNKYALDSAGAKIWTKGSWSRFTTGFYFTNVFNRFSLTGAAYYQGGRTPDNQKLAATLLSANMIYIFNNKFSAGPGMDYTSGGKSGSESHAFDPLYGTPHKFWGQMDYFYAANTFGNKGLQDYYLKTTYSFSQKLKLNADLHEFYSASAVYDQNQHKLERNFGTELDLVLNYAITGIVQLELGYSYYRSTNSLTTAEVKNVANARTGNNWAYLMINIKPGMIIK
ncbi:alginate export family protein [Flavitalea sp.]|nr:alginate export family protein [Flavitalea sp.]